MIYNLTQRSVGLAHAMYMQLRMNIVAGKDCVVTTQNPEKTKRDFEYVTGAKLMLREHTHDKNTYDASIEHEGTAQKS